jgi:hypothetical protein
MKKVPVLLLAMFAGFALTEGAMADPIPYPDPGTAFFTTYNFSAAFTGTETLTVYANSQATFNDDLLVSVAGGAFTPTGIQNAPSKSAPGFQFSFAVTQGQSIVFELFNANGQNWFSNAVGPGSVGNGKTDTMSHVYSTLFAGGQVNGVGPVIPAGTYIGFEDQIQSDVVGATGELNYTDIQIVMSEVAAVPELSTWAMLMVGFAGLGFMGYRRSRNTPPEVACG